MYMFGRRGENTMPFTFPNYEQPGQSSADGGKPPAYMSKSALNDMIVRCTKAAGLQLDADKLFAGSDARVNIEKLYDYAIGSQPPRREEEHMGRHSLQMATASQLWRQAAAQQPAGEHRRFDIGGALMRSVHASPMVGGRGQRSTAAVGGRTSILKMPVRLR